MRFKSRRTAAGQVFAVSGINTVSFAVAASERTNKGLLGFAVERIDPAEGERYYMAGFKVFRSVVPNPPEGLQVSTNEHPVQSFMWDDFTAKPDRRYEYVFQPLKGQPKNLDRSSPAMKISVRTEPLDSDREHDVFFNRGVASSQAYTRRFGSEPIDKLAPARREQALDWLTRDLDEAVMRFIDACRPGDRLLCCFYEFRYLPVAERLKAALEHGVDVRLIVDGKVNGYVDGKGKLHPSFPRDDNLALLAQSDFPMAAVILREARPSSIQHNKFMVRIVEGQGPTEVWTGSTNMSLGGMAGQTNVGHWVRNAGIAQQFVQYWDLLATDPGASSTDNATEARRRNEVLREAVAGLSPVPADLTEVPTGTTAVFSPRRRISLLESYAALLDAANRLACITLAFGVSAEFKDLLRDNTPLDQLVFLLLEKRDQPNPRSKTAFVRINASNNVYQAWGSYLKDPVYQWARETNAGLLGLNHHVSYVHSKFMLVDPLSADPIVVTGSANFSRPSTTENDENMIIVRGDQRVADIYLTEFNRLFNHYYFRSVTENRHAAGSTQSEGSLFLAETDAWQAKYKPGSLRWKRLDVYAHMAGFTRLP